MNSCFDTPPHDGQHTKINPFSHELFLPEYLSPEGKLNNGVEGSRHSGYVHFTQ